jgi:hypothetical protein
LAGLKQIRLNLNQQMVRLLRIFRIRPSTVKILQRFRETLVNPGRHLLRLSGSSRRTLAGSILFINVIWVILIYSLAVTALWWTSTKIIEDNPQQQALQWASELDELGTPL